MPSVILSLGKFPRHNFSQLHPFPCTFQFSLQLNDIPIACGYHISITHSSLNGRLDFYFLTIVNKPVKSMEAQLSLQYELKYSVSIRPEV